MSGWDVQKRCNRKRKKCSLLCVEVIKLAINYNGNFPRCRRHFFTFSKLTIDPRIALILAEGFFIPPFAICSCMAIGAKADQIFNFVVSGMTPRDNVRKLQWTRHAINGAAVTRLYEDLPFDPN